MPKWSCAETLAGYAQSPHPHASASPLTVEGWKEDGLTEAAKVMRQGLELEGQRRQEEANEDRRNGLVDAILADLEGTTRCKGMAKEEKDLRLLRKQAGQLAEIRGPSAREKERLEFQRKLAAEWEVRLEEKWRQVQRLEDQAWEEANEIMRQEAELEVGQTV